MKKLNISLISLILVLFSPTIFAVTLHVYKDNQGNTMITNMSDSDKLGASKSNTYTYQKSFQTENEEMPLSSVDQYKKLHQQWLSQGGRDSGIPAPLKPEKIVHELVFTPKVIVSLWSGKGLITTQTLVVPYNYGTYSDCMKDKKEFIRIVKENYKFTTPTNIVMPKDMTRKFTMKCESSVEDVRYSLVK